MNTAAKGAQSPRYRFAIEPNKVSEYRAAIGRSNIRTENCQKGVEAPLGYVFISNIPYGSYLLDEVVQLDYSKTLLGTVEWEYYSPVTIGEELEGITTISDITQRRNKKGQNNTFLTVETKLFRKEKLVLVNRAVFIETA